MVRLKETNETPLTKKLEFQFQYGAIKRQELLQRQISFSYFNSSMVRLKDEEVLINCSIDTVFQFQYGAIKSFSLIIFPK